LRNPGAVPAAERQTHVPGEAGVWILIFGEMSVFAAIFASFLYYRSFDVTGFTAAQAHLSKATGLANTLLLLTSSLFVAKGVEASRAGDCRLAPRCFAAALICALGFIAAKGFEYFELFGKGIAIDSQPFFGFYFGLTALHLGHVVIGSVLLALLSATTRTPLVRPAHFAMVESAGCFWHMVDLLWIVIFPLLYLIE
jgi:nitric oxide reductase NorE protein